MIFKKISIFSILLLLVAPVFCLNINVHAGILSGMGVQEEKGNWTLEADVETSFPVYSVIEGIMGMEYADSEFIESFKSGSEYFLGTTLSAYRRIISNENISFSAGADTMMGIETKIGNFETVVRPGVRLDAGLKNRASFYMVLNYPLVDITMNSQFTKPYIKIPNLNWYSLLTGWKLGYSIKQD